MTITTEILSKLPGDILLKLEAADYSLASLRADKITIPKIIKENSQSLGIVQWDVLISGGNLGIFIGLALALRGFKVAVMEKGLLKGREQEWNISRKELDVLLELKLISPEELNKAIATVYNPSRINFAGGKDIWIKDVLNVGICPIYLLENIKQKFVAIGGNLLESTPFIGAVVHPDGVVVNKEFSTRLLVDAMGHFSPIAKQAKQGIKADTLCLVVGTCAQGFPENNTGDLLLSFTALENQCQYFWEAFPAKHGRTTYLFTYMDTNPKHIGLTALFDNYFRLLPEYQGVELMQLSFQRALFGFFPGYRKSPLQTPWQRILPFGDSSGSQSPLSFGGFGNMLRHLKRLTLGIQEALDTDQLSVKALNLLQPYQPNLSVNWLFQKAMSVGIEQEIPDDRINNLLSVLFETMQNLGELVIKPFLKDVVQFSGLTKTLLQTSFSHPLLVIQLIPQLGLFSLLDWIVHYFNLGAYAVLFSISPTLELLLKGLPSSYLYYWHRWVDAWEYGSGRDYLK
ncbi:Lycopene cyclase, CruP type [Richelia intracellularis HH01]|uniref:Lycopene cyclase, CruP type n=1 Tax=Richelia intracellularis HH01 TaxID=1165094 RepID=M1X0V9_9NOST|nr:hypothetical protein [Richelia intracellularis]CCH67698.1 Lycopene cyclase, CruP type [Richelia intracellularis HH01]HAE06644.1 FAD-dependent oxidoreductase [Richelia sp.]